MFKYGAPGTSERIFAFFIILALLLGAVPTGAAGNVTTNTGDAAFGDNQGSMAAAPFITPRSRDFDPNKPTVTVTANSFEALYNGFAKSVGGVKSVVWSDGNPLGAELSGLSVPVVERTLPGETIVGFVGTGRITVKELRINSIVIDEPITVFGESDASPWYDVDITDSYNIVTVDGLLKVNPLADRRIKVIVTANSGVFDYDGDIKSVSGYTVEWLDGNPGGAELSGLSAETSRTLPGVTPALVTGTPTVTLLGYNVTQAYNIILAPGTLTVNAGNTVN